VILKDLQILELIIIRTDANKMDFLKANSSITVGNQTKSVSMRNALLHLFDPENYMPIKVMLIRKLL